ncbi:MAG TPA: bacterial proteasome activator family protein [Mycobacteriales bacterium]|nr:bacterial proteasome activator family protein [Mycobacteriales bacterium]
MSEPQQHRVVVVGPDGQPMGEMDVPAEAAEDTDGEGSDPTGQISSPAKVMRIGSMIKQLLEEVRAAPLDDASRARLREIHQTSIKELEEGLSPDLREELDRLTLPFEDTSTPSDAELRIAQAQLVGWLEGLFHGIQTALFAQQMAAQVQLQEMRRRALPGGPGPQIPGMPGLPGQPGQPGTGQGTGQYL